MKVSPWSLRLAAAALAAVLLLVCPGCMMPTGGVARQVSTARPPAAPPSRAVNPFEQGKKAYKSGDYAKAREHLLRAVKAEPTNSSPYNWLGWACIQLKQYDDAAVQFKIANNLQETDQHYKGLGEAQFRAGEYAKALASFQKYAELKPNDWHPYNRLGWTYFNLRKYEDAVIQFKLSNNLRETVGTHEGLGDAYGKLSAYDSALIHYRKWMELKGPSAHGHNRLGWTYHNLERYPDAIREFEAANKLEEHATHWRGIADCHAALHHYAEADAAYAKALELAPDDYAGEQTKLTWAGTYLARGNAKRAHELLGNRPYLGLRFKMVEKGVEILAVVPGSPAALAGLREGDLLVEFDGKDSKGLGPRVFYEDMIQQTEYGSTVKVVLLRHGRRLEKDLMIGVQPDMAGTAAGQAGAQQAVPGMRHATGVRWAVIIGISQYSDSRVPTLRYAASDAKAFHAWLVSPDGGKYSPSRVRLLLDKEATGANMKKALYQWLRQALVEDMVTIYFAGHGSPESPDSAQNLFLLPYDTQYDSVATTGFPMWDIETALKRFIKARKVVVIADACHSGGVGQSFDIARRGNRGLKSNSITAGLQSLSGISDGVCVISASDDRQFSQESAQWGGGRGVFTHHLLQGLKGAADYNRDKAVTLGELIPYLSEQVRRATRNAQSPTVSGKFDPALAIGR